MFVVPPQAHPELQLSLIIFRVRFTELTHQKSGYEWKMSENLASSSAAPHTCYYWVSLPHITLICPKQGWQVWAHDWLNFSQCLTQWLNWKKENMLSLLALFLTYLLLLTYFKLLYSLKSTINHWQAFIV